jgi:hypothetical protein
VPRDLLLSFVGALLVHPEERRAADRNLLFVLGLVEVHNQVT